MKSVVPYADPAASTVGSNVSRTVWVVLLVFFSLPLLLGIWFCVLPGILDSLLGSYSDRLSAREVESLTRVTFPPGMRKFQARAINFRSPIADPVIYVRFEVPTSELPTFLAATQCPPVLQATDARSYLLDGPQPPWWDPDKASSLQGTWSSHNTASPAQRIWVTPADESGWVIVYLFADYI